MADLDLTDKNSLPGTKRIEALADGIFAIAMTLLVLNLSFPLVERSPQSLLKMLSGEAYLSYPNSFTHGYNSIFVQPVWERMAFYTYSDYPVPQAVSRLLIIGL